MNQRKADRNHGRQDIRYQVRLHLAGKKRSVWFERALLEAGYRKDERLLQSMTKMKIICSDLKVATIKVAREDLTLNELMKGLSYGKKYVRR